MVDQTLANPKSWTHARSSRFLRIDNDSEGPPDFRVSLTSPMTIREGCGYDIPLEASCYNPSYLGDQASGVHQRGALGARGHAPSRATSGPTGST